MNPIGGLGLTGGLLDAFPLSEALIAVIEGRESQACLDAWAAERRRVFLEVTAPTAKENRRRVSKRDPRRSALTGRAFSKLTDDPGSRAPGAAEGVGKLLGNHPGSRT